MATLIALPVSGDAFLLEADNKTILVDGGRSGPRLAKALKEARPNLRHIDIIVCTHADSDHSQGLADLLANWRSKKAGWQGTVGEFWLPGRWRKIVAQALTDPKTLVDGVMDTIDAINAEHPELNLLETEEKFEEALLGAPDDDVQVQDSPSLSTDTTLDNVVLESVQPTEKKPKISRKRVFPKRRRLRQKPDTAGDNWSAQPDPSDQPDWFEKVVSEANDLFQQREEARHQLELGRRRIRYRVGSAALHARNRPSQQVEIGKVAGTYWSALIDTAEIIAEIARSAIASGADIRWFDQQSFEESGKRAGGDEDILLPMNAVEQVGAPVLTGPEGEVLYMLSISRANQESLVFYAPPSFTGGHGVLFSADNALTWGLGDVWALPAYAQMSSSHTVATAPHHGSEHNAVAYRHGWDSYNVCFWLRSHAGGTIGATFKALKNRSCTECPGCGLALRRVEISLLTPSKAILEHPCLCS
ncbi:MBL fold metallo-hydrolase [Novosphingobium sp. ZW T3_23]|uniref:MBL fold metallo-hydrolase n=1 Tax=Novosphingobium sp. ZW T3_23 TaxID=3378084 RepID=UPI00385363C9